MDQCPHGVIDDSDVFSVILDASNPDTVFASVSGIYKSENGGRLFQEGAGDFRAARTRILQQDPNASETVYAGTTEGLYNTVDGGAHFQRMTPASFILNDVLVRSARLQPCADCNPSCGGFSPPPMAELHSVHQTMASRNRHILSTVAYRSGDVYVGTLNTRNSGAYFGSMPVTGSGKRGPCRLGPCRARPVIPWAACRRHESSCIFLFNSKQQAWQRSRRWSSGSHGPRRQESHMQVLPWLRTGMPPPTPACSGARTRVRVGQLCQSPGGCSLFRCQLTTG